MPLVSVITPAHNASRFLQTTIESVRAQTFTDWEMVIAENGSSDGTPELVARAAQDDARIRMLQLPGAAGPARARNAALAVANGRYVAFLDSDDLWLPAKLERQLAYSQARDAAFTCTAYRRMDIRGNLLGRAIVPPPSMDYPMLLRRTAIGCLTVMLDRERVGPIQMLDLPQHEDLTLWYAILKRGIVAHGLDEDLARYRVVPGSASGDKLRSARHMWHVYRHVEGLSLGEAAECFVRYAMHASFKHLG